MKIRTYFILMITLLFISCNQEINITPSNIPLVMSFNHEVDGKSVQLDQRMYYNSLGQEYSIKTLKYFISNLKLFREDQEVIELPGIHYVDIRMPETLSYVFLEKIPEGNYTGMSFVFGLSPEENISGRFTEPPESLMEWPLPMGGGYHYMKLEGEYKVGQEISFFNFHSGMLEGEHYEIPIILDQPFEASAPGISIHLVMEIQNWFRNPNTWDFSYFGPAIMGNHEAQQAIHENGFDVFSFEVSSESN